MVKAEIRVLACIFVKEESIVRQIIQTATLGRKMAEKKKTPAKPKQPTPSERLAQLGIINICAQVAEGMSLREWCRLNGFALTTVYDWIEADKNRAEQYAHARDARADAKFESLEEIGNQAATAETAVEVAGLRLKADNLKWMLARMNAKKYGDKLAIGGASDLPPVRQVTSDMTPQDAARAYAEMMRGTGDRK